MWLKESFEQGLQKEADLRLSALLEEFKARYKVCAVV
jgi:hypothetical protein